MDLKELMQMGLERAANHIAKSPANDEVVPHFIGTDGKNISVYMTPWNGEFEKALTIAKLRTLFAEHGIIRYAMVSEVWCIARNADSPDERRPPSQCPDRQERLMVLGVEYGGSQHAYCDIIREDEKRRCGPPQWMTYGGLSGRMTTLLPERKMAS